MLYEDVLEKWVDIRAFHILLHLRGLKCSSILSKTISSTSFHLSELRETSPAAAKHLSSAPMNSTYASASINANSRIEESA